MGCWAWLKTQPPGLAFSVKTPRATPSVFWLQKPVPRAGFSAKPSTPWLQPITYTCIGILWLFQCHVSYTCSVCIWSFRGPIQYDVKYTQNCSLWIWSFKGQHHMKLTWYPCIANHLVNLYTCRCPFLIYHNAVHTYVCSLWIWSFRGTIPKFGLMPVQIIKTAWLKQCSHPLIYLMRYIPKSASYG